MTSIGARTVNYLKQEEDAWRSFPRPNLTESIRVVYETHSFNLDFNHGLLDFIWPYSDQLAQNITDLNRTAGRVLELVKKRSRWDLQNLADSIIRDVPRKLTAIFAEVRSLPFQRYLATVSDVLHWFTAESGIFHAHRLIPIRYCRTRTRAKRSTDNWQASIRMSPLMCTKRCWRH